ncbi:MAG: hypothetical protein P8Z35_25680 [Ignavibacteriaceae bacterium]
MQKNKNFNESGLNPDKDFQSLSKNGAIVVNGWYEGEEIYYIDAGPEEGITERGENQLYIIGSSPRLYQPQVVLFIPGEPGYSPHWNVNLVHTAAGKTVQDIINGGYAAENYNITGGKNLLFDDAEDIMDAEAAGIVTIDQPGIVVLCPIVSEHAADAPGNTELPDDEFPPFPNTF